VGRKGGAYPTQAKERAVELMLRQERWLTPSRQRRTHSGCLSTRLRLGRSGVAGDPASGGLHRALDAMGCQKDIAAQIRAKGADYLLVLKANHGRAFGLCATSCTIS